MTGKTVDLNLIKHPTSLLSKYGDLDKYATLPGNFWKLGMSQYHSIVPQREHDRAFHTFTTLTMTRNAKSIFNERTNSKRQIYFLHEFLTNTGCIQIIGKITLHAIQLRESGVETSDLCIMYKKLDKNIPALDLKFKHEL